MSYKLFAGFVAFLGVFVFSGKLSYAQIPVISKSIVPETEDIYTYKFIKNPGTIDTSLTGAEVMWDFNKMKDTAIYYEEVYRESLPSQDEFFEDVYSLDST